MKNLSAMESALSAFVDLAEQRRRELGGLSSEMQAVLDKATKALGDVELDSPTRCFVDQDGTVHSINTHTGYCTLQGDIKIEGSTVLLLGAIDQAPGDESREILDEFVLYPSLQALSDAIEKSPGPQVKEVLAPAAAKRGSPSM